MTVKTTGTEFWSFYNDTAHWPAGAWHDDTRILVNGAEVDNYTGDTIPKDAQLVLDGGVVFLDERGKDSTSFEGFFKKWRKANSTAFLSVECPKDKLEAVKAAIRAAGGKVA